MSERDELEQGAAESKAKQTASELQTYLNTVSADIEYTTKRHRSSSKIYLIVWACWMASSWLPQWTQMFETFFIFALIYDMMRFSRMMRAYAEYRGAIETLRILGYINRIDRGVQNKKSKFAEGIALVKKWATQKKKMKEEVYQPA